MFWQFWCSFIDLKLVLFSPLSYAFDIQFRDCIWQIHIEGEKYADVFKKDDLVYLTSDSENILEGIEKFNIPLGVIWICTDSRKFRPDLPSWSMMLHFNYIILFKYIIINCIFVLFYRALRYRPIESLRYRRPRRSQPSQSKNGLIL
jgi:hypothetical protein